MRKIDRGLIAAIKRGDLNKVIELIKMGADVNVVGEDNYGDLTPLHWVAKVGNVKIAEVLIKNGAKVDVRDKYGRTLLHTAIEYGRMEMVKFLIEVIPEIIREKKPLGVHHYIQLFG